MAKRSGRLVMNLFHWPRMVSQMLVKKATADTRMPTLFTVAMVLSQPGVGDCRRWWSPTVV